MNLLPPTFGFRGNIPLYFPKTEEQYKNDPYEQYHTVVLRNLRNYFLSDFGKKSIAFIQTKLHEISPSLVVENGCGIAYHIASLAATNSHITFIGFDTSYQMLKMGDSLYLNEKKGYTSKIPSSSQGHPSMDILSQHLANLQLGMAEAHLLPMKDQSVDCSFSVFLWDRLPDLPAFLEEQSRIINNKGHLILISPLNYQNPNSWQEWYPEETIVQKIEDFGFHLVGQEAWEEIENIDHRGNGVLWKVQAFHFQKV